MSARLVVATGEHPRTYGLEAGEDEARLPRWSNGWLPPRFTSADMCLVVRVSFSRVPITMGRRGEPIRLPAIPSPPTRGGMERCGRGRRGQSTRRPRQVLGVMTYHDHASRLRPDRVSRRPAGKGVDFSVA
jgi:hypothetical protein